jgi:hypothetical protein
MWYDLLREVPFGHFAREDPMPPWAGSAPADGAVDRTSVEHPVHRLRAARAQDRDASGHGSASSRLHATSNRRSMRSMSGLTSSVMERAARMSIRVPV